MIRLALVAALALVPAAIQAQDSQAQSGQPPQRIRNVTINKGQPCPRSTPNEVVVCSTLDEPYRIPRALRDDGPVPAQSQSLVNRAATMDQVSRVAGGLPDTCSPVGTGGQSGCALANNRQWAAEKRAERAASDTTP